MTKKPFSLACPTPLGFHEQILMAHGGGGKLTQNLLEHIIRPALNNPLLQQQHDSAMLQPPQGKLAFTTDSYVIQPIIFPGGDIGKLAVFGTVNDLAMSGAIPKYLSLSLILEEGLQVETLQKIVHSIREAAEQTGVQIVTGDTKVVDGSDKPGLFINTSGIGTIEHQQTIGPASIQPGDQIIVSGDLGRHGIAVMAEREGLTFETTLLSDLAPLSDIVQDLLQKDLTLHCLRDLTRGGLATALFELAKQSQTTMYLFEKNLPVHQQVQSACELLGLDPLYIANEGRFVAIVPPSDAEKVLEVLHHHGPDQQPRIVGEVQERKGAPLILKNLFGTQRSLPLLSGEQLPRIC